MSEAAEWVTVRVVPGAARDRVAAALFEAGAQGLQELDDVLVTHIIAAHVRELVEEPDPNLFVAPRRNRHREQDHGPPGAPRHRHRDIRRNEQAHATTDAELRSRRLHLPLPPSIGHARAGQRAPHARDHDGRRRKNQEHSRDIKREENFDGTSGARAGNLIRPIGQREHRRHHLDAA